MRYRGAIRIEDDYEDETAREGYDVRVRAQSPIGEISVSLYQSEDVDHCMIVIFDKRTPTYPGKVLYMGALQSLIDTDHKLLELMMFAHAQRMLTGEAA